MSNNSESSSESEVSEEESNDITLSKKEEIRQQISTMSFEDLQKLKQKIGAKVYDETVFGTSSKSTHKKFKRENKNRPREESAKKRFRPLNKTSNKPTVRDPRFDPLCGEYNDRIFKNNYKFVNDMRKNERDILKKKLKNEEDPKLKNKIKYVLQRLNNQIFEQERKEKEETKAKNEREEIKNNIKQGNKHIYKSKPEKRLEGLINQYEELKSSNKLQKHLERRSKKLAKKDRKRLNTVV